MSCFTPAGLAWFASTVALLRAQGASDIRVYTLSSSWCGVVPGTRTTDLVGEEKRHPVWGEDNLPNPWEHPGIRLLQSAMSPLFAMDLEFWELNAKSDAHGHFPIHAVKVAANQGHARNIIVFNDDLFGTEIVARWSLHAHSLSNPPMSKGEERLSIPLAERGTLKAAFHAPVYNCFLHLKLELVKDGEQRFMDCLGVYEVEGGKDYSPDLEGQERAFL
jgi:hypothetical protein